MQSIKNNTNHKLGQYLIIYIYIYRFKMGGKWPCSFCFVGCCFLDYHHFNIYIYIYIYMIFRREVSGCASFVLWGVASRITMTYIYTYIYIYLHIHIYIYGLRWKLSGCEVFVLWGVASRITMTYIYIYIGILQSSKSGVGNNSARIDKLFKFRILKYSL